MPYSNILDSVSVAAEYPRIAEINVQSQQNNRLRYAFDRTASLICRCMGGHEWLVNSIMRALFQAKCRFYAVSIQGLDINTERICA